MIEIGICRDSHDKCKEEKREIERITKCVVGNCVLTEKVIERERERESERGRKRNAR
jgi:hypothetical protein